MQNTISKQEGKALMKLVVNADNDQLLGAHMVGPEAAEILMVWSGTHFAPTMCHAEFELSSEF